jgi:hypothetical protein
MMSVNPSGNLSEAETGTIQMTDDISLVFAKMFIGHGRLLLGVLGWSFFLHYQKTCRVLY